MTTLTSVYARTIQAAWVTIGLASMALPVALPQQVIAQDVAADNEHLHEVLSGEVVYVPVYTHIIPGEKVSKQLLPSTLAIHNVDPSSSIHITGVRYYDHAGTELKDYLDVRRSLGPFASTSFVVDIKEGRGGVGANFIVE